MAKTSSFGMLPALLAAACLMGCADRLAEEDFKNAVPLSGDLEVRIGSHDSGETNSAELDPFADCDECCIEQDGADESYISGDIYELTREAKWHVNGGLLVTLGWVEAILLYPYSEKTDDGYIWGPWSEALSRISFRFVMTEDGGDVFSMRLEGKVITDPSDNWQPLVSGEVTAGGEPHRVSGYLVLDFDKVKELDESQPPYDGGKVRYDFDVRGYPYTVNVTYDDFLPEEGELIDGEYAYTRYDTGMSGKFSFFGKADITGDASAPSGDGPDGIAESFDVESVWDKDGKGKGAAHASGGSLSTDVLGYTLTECWADWKGLYYQTFEHVSIDIANAELFEETRCGAETNCPSI